MKQNGLIQPAFESYWKMNNLVLSSTSKLPKFSSEQFFCRLFKIFIAIPNAHLPIASIYANFSCSLYITVVVPIVFRLLQVDHVTIPFHIHTLMLRGCAQGVFAMTTIKALL